MVGIIPLAAAAFGTIVSAGIGAGALPDLTDAVLRWKRKLVEKAFEDGIESFEDAKEHHDDVDAGKATEASRWAEDMARNERLGKVEPWMAERLEKAGVIEKAREPERYLPCEREKWSFGCGIGSRVACGALGGAFGALMLSPVVTCGVSPWAAIPAVVLLAITLILVLCDVRTKTLPWQLCALAAVPSIALALVVWGFGGFAQCAAAAAVMTLALGAISYVAGAFGLDGGIGRGDMRIIPWLVLPLGANAAIWGALACFAVMLVGAAAKLVVKKASFGDYVPMAPGLLAWLAVGMAAMAVPVQVIAL